MEHHHSIGIREAGPARTRPRKERGSRPVFSEEERTFSLKELGSLRQATENIIRWAISDLDVIQRSSSFGIPLHEHDNDKTIKGRLREYDAKLKESEQSIQEALDENINMDSRERERFQHLLERVQAMRNRIGSFINAGLRELLSQPKDTDSPPSPWAAYRQDLIRRGQPEASRYTGNPYTQQIVAQSRPTQPINSPWANQKLPAKPTPPSFFTKLGSVANTIKNGFKKWFG